MFFVYEEGILMSMVVGGAANLDAAKGLAENRANRQLKWKSDSDDYVAEVDCGTYSITYRIKTGER